MAASEMAEEQLRTLLTCSAQRFSIWNFSVSSVVPPELSSAAVSLIHGPYMALMAFKKSFHFIVVHIPLDFLSLSDHPGVLHHSQPLLYKAAAESEDGCFGGVSPNVYAGFV
ncbi:unnamed protein product [Schistocephalus solidus]|uniref:Uncharacterized protein n=1 Tax=Schistocephalus solidus TaxID=70667 RepID=A0A183TNH6_SCHSO|nr:unnamed protein product [Schistocephalus solidus]